MTTVSRLRRLCGWPARGAIAAVTLLFCASAFADPSKNVVALPKDVPHKHVKKLCYRYIDGSLIPQPCDRMGVIPTTAGPMDVFGRYTTDDVIKK